MIILYRAMLQKIEQIITEVENQSISNLSELEHYKNQYLSKKGILNQLFDDFKNVPSSDKKEVGMALNRLKNFLQERYDSLKQQFSQESEQANKTDLTRPATPLKWGSRHPINVVRKEIIDIFTRMGYVVADGPEIEDDWHVFSALNFPEEHPARDMQDTFFIHHRPDIILRTHTSSIQVRVMETMKPPIRVICPGRVFRNEAISARAHCIFHQIEGLYIDKNVSFADLKQNLLVFARELFGEQTQIRLRPSYFPFTEPSAEMDVSCSICGGKGCSVCKHSGWLEIMGCGMVDPVVFDGVGYDSSIWTGYAFGMGLERLAMLLYGIDDIRYFYQNDLRFLRQFA